MVLRPECWSCGLCRLQFCFAVLSWKCVLFSLQWELNPLFHHQVFKPLHSSYLICDVSAGQIHLCTSEWDSLGCLVIFGHTKSGGELIELALEIRHNTVINVNKHNNSSEWYLYHSLHLLYHFRNSRTCKIGSSASAPVCVAFSDPFSKCFRQNGAQPKPALSLSIDRNPGSCLIGVLVSLECDSIKMFPLCRNVTV